mmetsp:Transcript_10575/g.25462  ORF Transcript_10575/g.25462 Transcript_10575/m.25462 type:complete len:543 (-) Transcript_10575:437-2065(-)
MLLVAAATTLLLAAAAAHHARASTACPDSATTNNAHDAVNLLLNDCGANDEGGQGTEPTLVNAYNPTFEFNYIDNEIEAFVTGSPAGILTATTGQCVACTTSCTHANLFSVTQDTLSDIQEHPRTFANTRACLRIDGVVMGDIKLSGNADCVYIPAGSFLKGALDFGAGDDCLLMDIGSAYAGRADFGAGDDDLVALGAKLAGRIDMGSGADYAQLETVPSTTSITDDPISYASLDGGLIMGEGDDSVFISGEGLDSGHSNDPHNRPVMIDLIEGREGDDQIVVNHGIVSIIDGGDGADTIQLQDGTVAELVDGEDGRDVIVTNYPATTTQADRTSGAAEPDFGQAVTVSLLSGGDGNDCAVVFGPAQIAIAGDDMSGFVGKIEMGRGDDTLSLGARTVVGGPIEMGEDRDHIMLRMGLINNDVNRAEVMCIAMDDTQDSVGATGQFGSLFVNGDITLDRRSKTNVAEFMTVAQAAAHNQNILINGALTLADQSLGPDAATCTFTSSEGGTAELGTATQEVLVARDGVTGCESTPGQFDVNP